jgi:hypothetical protein
MKIIMSNKQCGEILVIINVLIMAMAKILMKSKRTNVNGNNENNIV